MRGKRSSLQLESRAIRVAWIASFVVTLVLVLLLGAVRSAKAMPPAGGPSRALPVSSVGEELEGIERELEEALEELEEEGGFDEAPAICEALEGEDQEACEELLAELVEEAEEQEELEECVLSSAEATVTAIPSRDAVRLAVRYSTYSPGPVLVGFHLQGGRGPLNLGRRTAHFSRAGVFRETRRLSRSQMRRVVAARQFTVEVHGVAAPPTCNGLFDEKLEARRSRGASLLWSEAAWGARGSSR